MSLIEASVLLSWLQVIERMNGIEVEYANETLFTRSLRHLVTRVLVWWTKSIVCSCCRLIEISICGSSGIREQRRVKSSFCPFLGIAANIGMT